MEVDMTKPVLIRYGSIDTDSNRILRNATEEERKCSTEAAESDGGAGVIEIDGEFFFVMD